MTILGQRRHFDVSEAEATTLAGSDSAIDAAVCVLAARDFLSGDAPPPDDRELAEREGWIWLHVPSVNL